jgi:hypothetical protein
MCIPNLKQIGARDVDIDMFLRLLIMEEAREGRRKSANLGWLVQLKFLGHFKAILRRPRADKEVLSEAWQNTPRV